MQMGESLGEGPYTIEVTEDGEGGDLSAEQVGYSNTGSGLEATNVQGAIDELAGRGSSGAITFNGRSAAVVPQEGDYTANMVGALPSSTKLADLPTDESHRTVSDTEKSAWNSKGDPARAPQLLCCPAGGRKVGTEVQPDGFLLHCGGRHSGSDCRRSAEWYRFGRGRRGAERLDGAISAERRAGSWDTDLLCGRGPDRQHPGQCGGGMMVFLHRGGPTGEVGISAGDLEIGQVVHLNESGVPIDYLVVHQGIPSNLYDASCEGTWLLRKDIREMGPFNSGGGNALPGSSILSTMSGYMKDYDLPVQAAIKTVKVPYCVGNGSATVNSGENGLQCRVFPISGYEIGLNNSLSSYIPIDGAKLSYFIDGDGADA